MGLTVPFIVTMTILKVLWSLFTWTTSFTTPRWSVFSTLIADFQYGESSIVGFWRVAECSLGGDAVLELFPTAVFSVWWLWLRSRPREPVLPAEDFGLAVSLGASCAGGAVVAALALA